MSYQAAIQAQKQSRPVTPLTGGILQRKCACGQHNHAGGECVECRKKSLAGAAGILQRAAAVPSVVHEVLRAPGQPLDAATRAYLEPRLEHDFSQVRVHTDAKAAESARAVDALAYTVGSDIVFETGQYPPITMARRQLLAHELAHVVQQSNGIRTGWLQRQRSPHPAPVDANAQRIINMAADNNQPIDHRAVAVVRDIIHQYYPNDTSKVSRIIYREGEHGLHTSYTGRGATITGIIEVGRYFIDHTTQAHFARRVLQVRHEIEHIEQERSGLTGRSHQDEREFIAFYHEALATEPAGTGHMQHATRVSLIDAALGYYYCLSSDLQHGNTARRNELVARRIVEVRHSGRTDLGPAPTSCRRQS
jgi:hypothetical protein